jgi:hypothetical protein
MLDNTYVGKLFSDFSQVFQCDLGVVDFPTPEANSHPDLFAFREPTASISHLERTMMFGGFWSQPDLFDLDLSLCSTRFSFLFLTFVDEFTYVHHPADRRFGVWGNLHQVQVGFARYTPGLLDWDNAHVIAIRPNQADFTRSDPFIDTIF